MSVGKLLLPFLVSIPYEDIFLCQQFSDFRGIYTALHSWFCCLLYQAQIQMSEIQLNKN